MGKRQITRSSSLFRKSCFGSNNRTLPIKNCRTNSWKRLSSISTIFDWFPFLLFCFVCFFLSLFLCFFLSLFLCFFVSLFLSILFLSKSIAESQLLLSLSSPSPSLSLSLSICLSVCPLPSPSWNNPVIASSYIPSILLSVCPLITLSFDDFHWPATLFSALEPDERPNRGTTSLIDRGHTLP